MILRKKILPRNLADAAVTVFTLLMFPVIYWFQLFVVIPTFHETWSFWYNFNIIAGTIVFFNLAANYAAIILCDTSIKGRLMPTAKQPDWKFCTVCETLTPPRSWHCNVCNICILKRDHHCMFSSCCVGHHNQRYFLMFVLYMFVASSYAIVYDTIFISTRVDLTTFLSLLKVVFPVAMLVVEHSVDQTYLFLYLLILVACLFTAILLVFHMRLILKGKVTHECDQHAKQYDLGKMMNLKAVLGEHWYLVWISPFITSKLPSDGITWTIGDSTKTE